MICSSTASSSCFFLTYFCSKISSTSATNEFNKPSPSSSLGWSGNSKIVSSNSFWTLSWKTFSFSFSLVGVCVCEPSIFPDNPGSLLPKVPDESCAGIRKFPKELSDPGGGVWNELKAGSGCWKGGGGGGGMNGPGPCGSDGGDGGEERLLLLLLLFLVLFQYLLTCLIDFE